MLRRLDHDPVRLKRATVLNVRPRVRFPRQNRRASRHPRIRSRRYACVAAALHMKALLRERGCRPLVTQENWEDEAVMKHHGLIALTVALAMGLATTSWAAGGGGGGGGAGGGAGGAGGGAAGAGSGTGAGTSAGTGSGNASGSVSSGPSGAAYGTGTGSKEVNGISPNGNRAGTNSDSSGTNANTPGYNGTTNPPGTNGFNANGVGPSARTDSGSETASGVSPGPCRARVGNDDTIGGRTGPPGSPMINSGQTGTPTIAVNPPCGPK